MKLGVGGVMGGRNNGEAAGRVYVEYRSTTLDGAKTALLGANGTGKTTLLRLIAGDLEPAEGTIVRSGGLGVMRQFIGSVRDGTTVRAFLAAMAPARIRDAATALAAAELGAAGDDPGLCIYSENDVRGGITASSYRFSQDTTPTGFDRVGAAFAV